MKAVLRNYIKSANLQKNHSLKDCSLVIDGHAFFKDSYRDSGCQFIVGPECDQYAKYLINKLTAFQKYNIKCYVIFKGTTKQDVDESREMEKHQTIIDSRRLAISHQSYFDPLLLRDVQLEVLNELSIKYFCCQYDSIEAIIGVAREFKCPVVTTNVDYCLFGVSCILPKDILYHNGGETLQCIMYEYEKYKSYFGLYNKMPILLSILNMGIDFSDAIPEWSECKQNSDLRPLIRWTKRQRQNAITNLSNTITDENQKVLSKFYRKTQILYLYPTCNLAVKYFKRSKPYGLFKDDKKWFSKGVSSGRIAVSFVDIKQKGFITGSTQIYDENKSDALKAASRIIAFSHCVLTNSQTSSLSFIGRKNKCSSFSKIDTSFQSSIMNSPIFTKLTKNIRRNVENPFLLFLNDIISDLELRVRLKYHMPEDSIILCFALVYYVLKINENFIDGAYFVFLSYFMIGHVKKIALNIDEVPYGHDIKEYKRMYDELNFLFDEVDLKHKYDISIIHSLAEFQHCLEYINYLNKLCGNVFRPTRYCVTYNATLIYNAFVLFKNKDNLMKYLNTKYMGLNSFKTYVELITHFSAIVGSS